MSQRLAKLAVAFFVPTLAAAAVAPGGPAEAAVSVSLASVGPSGQLPDSFSILQDVTAAGDALFASSAPSFLDPGVANFTRLYMGHGGQSEVLTPVVTSSVERAGISDNGRFVAFVYAGTGLDLSPGTDGLSFDPNGQRADVFLLDRTDHTVRRLLAVGTADAPQFVGTNNIDVSEDGRFVVFDTTTGLAPGDTNGASDVYRFDRQDASLDWVSAGPAGAVPDGRAQRPRATPDGSAVVFLSDSTDLVAGDTNGVEDVFVWEAAAGETTRANTDAAGNQLTRSSGFVADISDDARYVVFDTSDPAVAASFLGTVIRKDRTTGETIDVSDVPPVDGRFSVGGRTATISGDGRVVAYESDWSRYTTGQFGQFAAIVARDLTRPDLELVSRSLTGGPANGNSGVPMVSADGTAVGFGSFAGDLVSPSPQTPSGGPVFAVYLGRPQPDDAVPPTAAIASPTDGSTFALGSTATVSYSCADNLALAAVDPCVGSVPDGGRLDTTSPGPRTVSVTATDAVGLTGSTTAAYTVTADLDDPFATGSLLSVDPGLTASVTDAADPADGVTVTVSPGPGRATFRVCGGFTVRVTGGSTVTITCGSVTLRVAAGTGQVELDGGATVVAVGAGSAATVDLAAGGEPVVNVRTGTATVTGVGGVTTTIPAAAGTGGVTRLCQGRVATIVGTPGPDKLTGTARADVIVGLAGNDKIEASAGDDVICGGDGSDTIEAGDGSDQVDGGNGADKISGGRGDDVLSGGSGDDTIEGGGGLDAVTGGEGTDKCSVSAGSPPKQSCER